MKRMFFCALLSTTIWAGVLENNYTKEEFNKMDSRSGEEIAKKVAEDDSKELPIKIDDIETITNIMAINTKIYYKREVNDENDKKINEVLSNAKKKELFIKIMYKTTQKEKCTDKTSKQYLYEKNIGFQNDYYKSSNKEYIGGFSIDKSDCIELEKQQQKRGKNPLL